MNMIEKVARALCWNNGMNPDLTLGGDGVNFLWMEYEDKAKAAIEAMYDPTEAITTAGIEAWRNHYLSPVTQWRAMIDAALKEEE